MLSVFLSLLGSTLWPLSVKSAIEIKFTYLTLLTYLVQKPKLKAKLAQAATITTGLNSIYINMSTQAYLAPRKVGTSAFRITQKCLTHSIQISLCVFAKEAIIIT